MKEWHCRASGWLVAWLLPCVPLVALAQAAGKVSPQAECTAINRQKVAELTLATDAARNKNLFDPVRVARLQAVGAQLGKLREAAQRMARTPADCEALAAQIDAEAQRLARINGSDDTPAPAATADAASAPPVPTRAVVAPTPPPAAPPPPDPACITSVGQDFNEAAQTLAQLQRARGDSTEPDAELAAASTRLNSLRQGLLAALKTPPDAAGCARLSQGVALEAQALQQVQRSRTVATAALSPPPVLAPALPTQAPCIAANSQAYDDLVQRFGALLQGGELPPHVLPPAQSLGRQLAAMNPQFMPGRTTAAECSGNGRALVQADAELQRVTALLAGPAPARAAYQPRREAEDNANDAAPTTVADRRARACVSELRLNFDQVLQVASNMNARGKLNAEGRAQLKRLLQDLLLQQVVLFSRDVMSLEECQQIAQTFSNLRAQVRQVGAALGGR